MTVNGRQPIKFGGVILDANQVKTKRVEKGLKNDVYIVEFKSGVKARYEMQNAKQQPALNSQASQFNAMSKDKVMNTEGWNLKGLTIEGCNVRDDMRFHDCEDTVVNNYNDEIKDSCKFIGGKNNKHIDR